MRRRRSSIGSFTAASDTARKPNPRSAKCRSAPGSSPHRSGCPYPGYARTRPPGRNAMATTRQKEAARRNLEKARAAQSVRARGKHVPRQSKGMSTAEENRFEDSEFAFPEQRKEPLTDASHVRN